MDRVVSMTPNVTPASIEPGAAAAGATPLVDIRDLSVHYQQRSGLFARKIDIVAVDRVSLSVERGRTLGLVGATGSGKSTIAQAVVGMVQPTSGTIVVAGHDVSHVQGSERLSLQRLAQVVLQDPYSSLDPRMRVGDIIAEPLTLGRPSVRGSTRARVAARVAELLDLVGLSPTWAERYPHQFSGGQRQRIAIARALAPQPQLIVLDEPTSALDVSVRAQILTLLKRLQAELAVTYLVISHDLTTVAYLASDVAVMHLGRVVEIGPTSSLFRSPRHPYTLELLASAPGAEGHFLRQTLATRPPSAMPPGACRYAYRCTLRSRLGDPDRCLEEDPALTDAGPDHQAACHFSADIDAVIADAEADARA